MPTKYWPVEAEAEAAEDGSEEAAAEEVVAAVVEVIVVVVNMHGACIVALFKGKIDKCE